MCRGRRRDQWEHTTALMAWIARVFTGERVDPENLNPVPRLEAERPALDPAAEAAEGWGNLKAAFTELARQRRHNGGG